MNRMYNSSEAMESDGLKNKTWQGLKSASTIPEYMQAKTENSIRNISLRLQQHGVSAATADVAAYPIGVVLLLLTPLMLSTVALTATVLLFSFSFLVSSILCGLAATAVFISISLFMCIMVVSGLAVAALVATTFMAFVIILIAILLAPLFLALRLRKSHQKQSRSDTFSQQPTVSAEITESTEVNE